MKLFRWLFVAAITAAPFPALAVDPPYQGQMERLSEILGSLYMLAPLCGDQVTDWRGQMAELIELDEPDEDRRARLAGAFNAGYEAYARFYRSCTPSAEVAITRLLTEGDVLARDIHQRYAE
ncbi:TIGR02301 family protein [Pelagibacterium sp.]|uniref:TIGR02301 family protein n=1 Tax=Pelagibacterium sp. TaxID=1967288 RepID=UPI003BAC7CBD